MKPYQITSALAALWIIAVAMLLTVLTNFCLMFVAGAMADQSGEFKRGKLEAQYGAYHFIYHRVGEKPAKAYLGLLNEKSPR